MKIAALVLAAGQSTRMGADNKLLLPFRDSTVVGETVDAVLGSGVSQTVVVLGHEAERVREALSGKAVTLVENPAYREGMATSVHAGIRALAPGTEAVMVCLSDLPLVEAAELRSLMEAFAAAGQKSLAVPVFQGRRGNPVLFSIDYRDEILHVRGAVGGCKSLVARYPRQVLEVEMDSDHVLQDIDTMETYRRVLARAGEAPAPGAARP